MRIISGSAKGRKLAAPKDQRVRPTADRIKEALFSIVASRLGGFDDCRVLDLFAGTGNLGIEALSRGSAYAVFIDSHPESVRLIRENIQRAGVTERATVLSKDVLKGVAELAREKRLFDLVFVDPPYQQRELRNQVLALLGSGELLADEAIVIIESSAHDELPHAVGSLELNDRRSYGDTALTIYTRSSGE